MSELPKIGRPNKSGLSLKLLGPSEYSRRIKERKRRAAGIKATQKTGLSLKLLGVKNYAFALRYLNRNPTNDE